MERNEAILFVLAAVLLIILVSIQYTLNQILKVLIELRRAKLRDNRDFLDRTGK